MVRKSGVDAQVSWRTGLLLSVGGEFGLALVAIALDSNVIDMRLGQIAITSVLLSMIVGAVLIRFNAAIASWLAPVPRIAIPSQPTLSETTEQQVVIAGYGRVGHTIAVLLDSSGVPFVVFETDPKQVAKGRQDGYPVYFGDISDPELLSAIHVERASLVIITADGATVALRALSYLQRHCPQVPVVARARDLATSAQLLQAGAVHAYPETIEASLRLGAASLQILQVPTDDIDQMLQGVRDRGYTPVLGADAGKKV